MRQIKVQIVGLIAALCISAVAWAGPIEDALDAVRDTRADMYSRQSSVLGELPSPAEYAAMQYRARPVPRPQANCPRTLNLNEADQARVISLAGEFLDNVMKGKGNSRSWPVIPLGITGAQVRELRGHTQFAVLDVMPKTPAEGHLKVGDTIVGANGKLFTDAMDPRPELGYALATSQSPQEKGIITFHVVRDTQLVNVDVDLGSALYYSDTWPFDCRKSDLLRKQTTEVVTDNDGDRLDFWTPLFLMASGDDGAMEKARRMLYGRIPTAEQVNNIHASSWSSSYRLIAACEYYLLTGDSAIMPEIKRYARIIEYNQFPSGGWSHGHGQGYGEITNVGLPSLMGLILARECGLKVDEAKIARSVRAFGLYCGTNFPYGMGTGGAGRSGRMDNGMNSMAAVIYHLLGEDEMARRWARGVCYMWMAREHGHAEGIFSMAWGPIGAALAPKPEFQMFMNEMMWAYELGRGSDGGMMFLRKGRVDYPVNQTAAMGLFLFLPQHRLRILGAEKGVFGSPVPPQLKEAADLFYDKKWDEMKAAVAASGMADSKFGKQLLAACDQIKRDADFTLKQAVENIKAYRPATAEKQLDEIVTLLGYEPDAVKALRPKIPAKPRDTRKPEKPLAAGDSKKWGKHKPTFTGTDGGFACTPSYIVETNAKAFDGMAPEQIARYIGHFNGGPAGGALMALGDQGKKALPLILKLLHDTAPYVRAGAVGALAQVYHIGDTEDVGQNSDVDDAKGEDGDTRQTSPKTDLATVITLLQPLANDPHPAVQRALIGVINRAEIENPATKAIAVDAAGNSDPTVQGGAMRAATKWLKDPNTQVKIAIAIMKAGKFAGPHVLSKASVYLLAHKEMARAAVPAIIRYINEEAHLCHGFFTNGPPDRGLQIFNYYLQEEPGFEKTPGLVGAIAKSLTRTPYNTYGGWIKIRKMSMDLLLKLSPAMADAVAKAAQEEKAWLATEDPELIEKATVLSKPEVQNKLVGESIQYLEDVAAWLKAGKPKDTTPKLAFDPADPQDTHYAEKKAAEAKRKKAKDKQEAAKNRKKKAAKGVKSPKAPKLKPLI